MVVVAGQILRELVPTEPLVGEDPPDDTGLLQRREIAVHRALLQRTVPRQDGRQRERAPGPDQGVDQEPAPRRVALPDRREALRHLRDGAPRSRLRLRHHQRSRRGPLRRRHDGEDRRCDDHDRAARRDVHRPAGQHPGGGRRRPDRDRPAGACCANDRASSCAEATGSTVSAAISRMPTTFIADHDHRRRQRRPARCSPRPPAGRPPGPIPRRSRPRTAPDAGAGSTPPPTTAHRDDHRDADGRRRVAGRRTGTGASRASRSPPRLAKTAPSARPV